MKLKYILILFLLFMGLLNAAELKKVTQPEIEDGYEAYLPITDRFLTQTGVKKLKLPDGGVFYCCIVYTPYKGDSAIEHQKMITVCRSKAMTELLKSKSCKVYAYKSFKSHSVEVSDGTNTTYKNVSELLSLVQTEVSGEISAWPVIAYWTSADKSIFYLATGRLYDKDHKAVEMK